ncbi:hypothetical protein RISK_005932 [Rhodopirellula islandica]|uniref:Uncharacterized protein n=1 Tax=Rhodopirellula islandica TaxID=595434 RepID=A0A0J1B6K2_RHOIS|nr:hypothetical protein RISK_005932 [Rhodopirellula islandica]
MLQTAKLQTAKRLPFACPMERGRDEFIKGREECLKRHPGLAAARSPVQ